MASTYSTSLGLELIGQGEQSGTWGITTNNNFGTLVEQAITGVQTITMSNATYTLSFYQGAADEARNAVLVVKGTNLAPQNLIAPGVNKTYIVNNQSGNTVNITTSGGNAVSILNNTTALVYCDGTNFYSATPSLNSVIGNLSVTGSGSFGSNVTATNNIVAGANAAVGGNLVVTGAISAGSFTGITGRIVQTVVASRSIGFFTTSGSPVPSGVTATITPTSTASKILVLWTSAQAAPNGSGGNPSGNSYVSMYRNGSNLAGGTNFMCDGLADDSNLYFNCAMSILDSPATTSSLTYQPYVWADINAGIYGYANFILMEIL